MGSLNQQWFSGKEGKLHWNLKKTICSEVYNDIQRLTKY